MQIQLTTDSTLTEETTTANTVEFAFINEPTPDDKYGTGIENHGTKRSGTWQFDNEAVTAPVTIMTEAITEITGR